jgi:HSP20 family protein
MLTRWNDLGFGSLEPSFAALNGLRAELDRIFQRYENDWNGDVATFSAMSESAQPTIQVRDEGDDLRIRAEVPGFNQEDLHVSFEQGSLIIRGERRDEVPEGYSVHRKERGTVRFARAFSLPARIDPDKIEAMLKDGILELRLPKAAEERPRTISVQATS